MFLVAPFHTTASSGGSLCWEKKGFCSCPPHPRLSYHPKSDCTNAGTKLTSQSLVSVLFHWGKKKKIRKRGVCGGDFEEANQNFRNENVWESSDEPWSTCKGAHTWVTPSHPTNSAGSRGAPCPAHPNFWQSPGQLPAPLCQRSPPAPDRWHASQKKQQTKL